MLKLIKFDASTTPHYKLKLLNLKNIFTKFGILLLLSINFIQCSENNSTVKNDTSYLEEISLSQLQAGYKSGEYTVEQVVKDYLNRIATIDKNGPQLNSVICINPDAIAIAIELDKELKAGKSRGPLHGVPILLKDNIDTHDKMPTTAGALVLKNSYPLQDSKLVAQLRKAGAVILGKTNLSEWANFRSSMSSSGWSDIGGQSKNPYVLDRNPCGSSSGSGVAVAANLCLLAIGTETNGSIVCPSNNNGIVGLKPTVGLISRSGVVPISYSQDTPGPMTRAVSDLAYSLGAMVGVDSNDAKTLSSAGHYLNDYSACLKKEGLKGKRIGLLTNHTGFNEQVDSLFTKTRRLLEANGATVIEVSMKNDNNYEQASFEVLLYEFKDGLNKYFSTLGPKSPIKSLADLIAYNKKNPEILKKFNQKLLEMAEAKGDLRSKEYLEALEKMQTTAQKNGIDLLLNSNKLDALMAPTGSPAWKTDHLNGDHYIGGSSSLAAIAGYPSITLPMGFVSDLPVGISFFGTAWSEAKLIEIAYAYEQKSKVRKAPKYLAKD